MKYAIAAMVMVCVGCGGEAAKTVTATEAPPVISPGAQPVADSGAPESPEASTPYRDAASPSDANLDSPEPRRIVTRCLGDATTASGYPARMSLANAAGPVRNLGKPLATCTDLLQERAWAIGPGHADFGAEVTTIVLCGGEGITPTSSVQDVVDNVQALVTALAAQGDRVIVGTLLSRNYEDLLMARSKVNSINVKLRALPHPLADFAASPWLGGPKACFSGAYFEDDGIAPKDPMGTTEMANIADAVWKTIPR